LAGWENTKSNRPRHRPPSDNAYTRARTIGFVLHGDGALPDVSRTTPHLQ